MMKPTNMKDNPKLLKFHLVHLLVLTIFVWISFYINENGDTNVIIFGIILYLPFVILLIAYNILAILIINEILEIKGLLNKVYLRIIGYMIPIIPILIWYLFDDYSITVGNWPIEGYYFGSLIFIWLILNLILYLFVIRNEAKK